MIKSVIINGRKRETNHHLNLQQILPANVTTATKSVDQGSDFTATGYAVFKNDSTKAQSPITIVKHDRRLPTITTGMRPLKFKNMFDRLHKNRI